MIDVVYLILWPVAWDSSPGKERQESFRSGIVKWYSEVPRCPDYMSIKLDCDVIDSTDVVPWPCHDRLVSWFLSSAMMGWELTSSALCLAQLIWAYDDRLLSWFSLVRCDWLSIKPQSSDWFNWGRTVTVQCVLICSRFQYWTYRFSLVRITRRIVSVIHLYSHTRCRDKHHIWRKLGSSKDFESLNKILIDQLNSRHLFLTSNDSKANFIWAFNEVSF